MSDGCTYIDAVKKLFELVDMSYSFGEQGVKTKRQYKYPKEVVCNDKETVYKYFETRKISRQTVDYLDVRQDESGNAVFNFYDENDVLTVVKYKPSHKLKKGETKTWAQQGADTTPLLFNMNRINVSKPLLIVEGEPDCMAAVECGYLNSVSVPFGSGNFQWIEENWNWLEQFNSIIICSDNDEPGIKMQKEIIYRLGSWRTKVVDIPLTIQKGEKHFKVKDLNEYLYHCGKLETLNLLLNAKDTPVPSVHDLSDVDDIDLDEIEGVYSGIHPLDKELIRFFYGTLTVISGMPGSGKSSEVCQLICSSLDQGVNTWLFSGELPEFMNKNWFNYIFAGRRNIKEYKFDNGDAYYKVSPKVKKQINDCYRGRWFIYQDDWENNLDLLIESMTDVVRKYGVKFLILDNMMTIDVTDGDEELREQTKTIKKLIAFSKKYNVATILIAHPRKLNNTATVGMYDISGTANISNLAHRTIGMRKVTPEEKDGTDKYSTLRKDLRKYDVVLNIIKDRLRGRSNINLGLYYDIPSRRFFTSPEEYDRQYKWDTNTYTEPLPYPIVDETEEVLGRISGEN